MGEVVFKIVEILSNHWPTLLMMSFAWVFKALMDVSGKDGFNIKWFNKEENWENKYEDGLITNHRKGFKHWYYFGLYFPKYKEKIIFSSTILIFLFDGWHLFMFVFLKFIDSGYLCELKSSDLVDYLLYSLLIELSYAICFNVTFEFNLNKNKYAREHN